MPWTPESSTSSAERKASIRETPASPSCSSRSLGMTIRVSHSLRSPWMPSSAWPARRRPSKVNGRVTTPMVSAPELARDRGHHRRAAGAGAAALAGGDEDHVGTLEDLLDLLAVVLGGLAADLRVGPGAEAAGQLAADVELDVGVGHQQGLGVGVHRDELDALEADLDHAVDGVDATATDADNLDHGQVVVRGRHRAHLPVQLGSVPRGSGPTTIDARWRSRTGSSRRAARPQGPDQVDDRGFGAGLSGGRSVAPGCSRRRGGRSG